MHEFNDSEEQGNLLRCIHVATLMYMYIQLLSFHEARFCRGQDVAHHNLIIVENFWKFGELF